MVVTPKRGGNEQCRRISARSSPPPTSGCPTAPSAGGGRPRTRTRPQASTSGAGLLPKERSGRLAAAAVRRHCHGEPVRVTSHKYSTRLPREVGTARWSSWDDREGESPPGACRTRTLEEFTAAEANFFQDTGQASWMGHAGEALRPLYSRGDRSRQRSRWMPLQPLRPLQPPIWYRSRGMERQCCSGQHGAGATRLSAALATVVQDDDRDFSAALAGSGQCRWWWIRSTRSSMSSVRFEYSGRKRTVHPYGLALRERGWVRQPRVAGLNQRWG